MNDEIKAKVYQTRIERVFEKVSGNLVYGLDRWNDEREFESIQDYAVLFEKDVREGLGEFVKMTSDPFGFIARFGGLEYHFYVDDNVAGVRLVK